MTLTGIFLKLIEFLGLTSSEELRVLTNDVKEWVKTCGPDSTGLKLMYFKLHEGVFFRLLAPFLYFVALREAKKIMTEGNDTDFIE
ncbi:hypothetical protein [Wocania ichthyoenteri]|uniref:hypothetical protein n=1 Tax=Wocania ichthyoenteri TaxID=1230531 RepID=UPI00053E4D84|nr:hypothetical protein [Wocania ichthyoenteri]